MPPLAWGFEVIRSDELLPVFAIERRSLPLSAGIVAESWLGPRSVTMNLDSLIGAAAAVDDRQLAPDHPRHQVRVGGETWNPARLERTSPSSSFRSSHPVMPSRIQAGQIWFPERRMSTVYAFIRSDHVWSGCRLGCNRWQWTTPPPTHTRPKRSGTILVSGVDPPPTATATAGRPPQPSRRSRQSSTAR